MRVPLAWNFAYFRQPPPLPPFFFFNQNDSTVEYFCIDLKGFFYALIKFAFTHLTIPFFFLVSQTLNTALGKRGEKKKLTLLLPWIVWNLFLKECVRLGRSLGFPFAWQSQVSNSSMGLRDIRWGWLYLMWDTEDTTAFHPTHSFQVCMALSLAKQFWCSCLQVLKYLLSTTLLRSYLCLSWCWKIPVKFKKH